MQVTILSGIPGSGKSTYVGAPLSLYNTVVCSADNFFIKDGEYNFDFNKLGKAHTHCMRKFIEACSSNTSHVIVDNTNTTDLEIAPYYQVAKAFGYDVELVTIQCDPEIGAARNKHGVPLASCKAMADRIARRQIPKFWNIVIKVIPAVI